MSRLPLLQRRRFSFLSLLLPQVLALELVKILLENSGPVFRHSEKFVAAIKQYLCLSLLKNATSAVTQAQALTSSIFFTLLTKFRHSLKAEIGVFFPMILLRAIEPATPGTAPNTSGQTSIPPPACRTSEDLCVRNAHRIASRVSGPLRVWPPGSARSDRLVQSHKAGWRFIGSMKLHPGSVPASLRA